ncbi:MAG: GntR family transcriptional regulator [Ferrovibrio sp.]|uniref:GntR family transcriptional regulator n=1 Tax=Ferrovibrio sp. TaxID=1917215 RepID=UPI00261829BA|nr:GntR family transcriptional regulator [Ferrovibrio sp.]MCW0235489.1 GntR family transcriptional regulator [Ferrovibrio sp.]
MTVTVSRLALTPPRDRSRLAAPQVFEHLREKIIALELVPGTVLSRQELQLQFGLSSTPIRDALIRLAEESLVEIFPQHATRVSPIDLTLTRQAHFLRRSIETEAVQLLTQQRNPDLIAGLRNILKLQLALAEAGDLARFNDADQAFHRQMYEAAGVPDLWTLVRRHSGHIDRLRRLYLPIEGRPKQIVGDHTAIVDAIDSGDPEHARAALRHHLSRSLTDSAAIRAKYPAWFRD